MTTQAILEMIKLHPVEIGHWVDFSDLGELHNEWLRSFLFGTQDQTLQAHRGSYKTTVLSLFLAIHAVIAPSETVIYFRKTGGDVAEVARQVANILHSGCMREISRTLYGIDLSIDKETGGEIHTNLARGVKGQSQIVGLGIGTSITGKHADIVVTDDIVNLNDRQSVAERERTKRAYMELQNIRNRGGRFVNTGTPWHKDDAFSLMPSPVKYTWKDTGLITPEQAEEIKRGMTNSLFAANYELRHIAEDDVIFANPQTGADITQAEQGWSHIDAAYYGEDWTAMTVLNIHGGKIYVYGRCWRRHIDDVMDECVAIHEQMKSSKLYVEKNADKGYVAKEFRKRGVRTVPYTETQNKYIKITSHLKFRWSDVVFVQGTDERYIEQITDYNDRAAHDDCPDSLASLIRAVGKKTGDNEEEFTYLL